MTASARPAGGAPTLTLTRPLLRWLRQDANWPALPAPLRARLAWLAALGSLNLRLAQAVQRGDAASAALPDPVFVVGPWRSGTTVLHELLVAATHGAAPRTWQCMNAAAFALGAAPRGSVAAARPMDGLPVLADSPQEDEFALLTVGIDSAYRAFWMPHRIGELHHTVEPDYWLQDSAWLVPWTQLLLAMQARQGPGRGPPLILKSPNHTWRLPALLQRFPKARFVWMARDPAQVLPSNRAMWLTMFRLHGLTAADPAALERFLELALTRAAAVLEGCAAALPPSQWVVLTHEQLRADPAAATAACLQRLGLPCDAQALASALRHVAGGRVEKHLAAAPSVALDTLAAAQHRAAGSHGLHLR